jgi:photosystem II stability/assembly factor-like uncharacterized protein
MAISPNAKTAPQLAIPPQIPSSKLSAANGTNGGFVAGADTGNSNGETGEDPKNRANYFYAQRAYPNDFTPAGARLRSLEQLDTMIAQQRAAGLLPPADIAAVPPIGWPEPSVWTNIGPQPVTNGLGGANFGNPAATGRVSAIAVDPTTPTTVFLGGATGGIWKSTDGGTTWNSTFDQNKSLAIGGIGIAPSNHLVIYAGTGELNFSGDSYYGAGVYKSTDGGATWTQQCGGVGVNFCTPTFSGTLGGGFYVGAIAVNPTNPLIALAAVRDPGNSALSGIYRTTDGGTTWTLIPSASTAAGNSVVWNQGDNTIVYATLGERGVAGAFGVYKSTDSGVTFTRLTGTLANLPTANLGRHELGVSSDGATIYVSINAESTSNLLGLAKSTDSGATWTFNNAPSAPPSLPDFCHGQCWYDMAVAVDPLNANTVIVGGSAFTNNSSTIFRSSDGGATWTDITVGSNAVRPHVDTHALTFANNGGAIRLYTGDDGGIWFTDNPTSSPVTWQPGNNANLVITQFYPGHSVHPTDDNIDYGGTQDNGTEKYSGTLAWDHVACGDGAWTAVDPIIPSTVYANCQNIAVFRSPLDGAPTTFAPISNQLGTSGDRSLFIPPLVHDPNTSGLLYFGTFRVWQTMDYGTNWTAISPDLTLGGDVTSVSPSSADSNTVYATTSDGRVWRTTNALAGAGATWTNLTKAPLPNRYATMVKTAHGDANTAYVSYSGFNGFGGDVVGHIFKTSDGGTTWSDISGTGIGALPNSPVNDIVVDHVGAPLNIDQVFIGTDVGVFKCPDPLVATPCTTWSPITGLPTVPVVGLTLREASQELRAATHGRGVWDILVPGVNPAGLLLVTSISPSSVAAGSGSAVLTFTGNDFGVPSGTPSVLVDGSSAGVTNVIVNNANSMTATLGASITGTAGLHQITVNQPGHAPNPQNPTAPMPFSVTGPAPTLTNIAPNQANTGSPATPMTLTGTNFVCGTPPAQSIVYFGTTPLTPSTCSATSLTVTIPAPSLTTNGTVLVKVFDPGPGGGSSATQAFTVGSPASNDNFASAIAITTLPFSDTENTGLATTEIGETVPSLICTLGGTPSAATKSIWYSYTPGASGVVTFTSPGETEAGIIQVVTGAALGGLATVPGGCSFDATTFGFPTRQAATVKVTGGVTYHIMLSDFSGTGGTGVVSAAATPPPVNDDFANAIAVTAAPFTDTRTTTGATTEAGEPIPACTTQQAASTHSVWYKYTPGSSGAATFTTNTSSIDSIIQVVTGSLGAFTAVTGGCADANGQGVGETVTFNVTSGTTYFIMVSDWNGLGGTTVLNFTSGPAPTGGGVANVTMAPSPVPFGSQTQGITSSPVTITVSNTGTASATLAAATPVTITGANAADFAIVPGTTTCNANFVLVATTGSCIINVTFTPGATGARTATVNVADNAPGSPQTDVLNGTGIVANVTMAPSPVPFGSQAQGTTSAAMTITVSNTGTAPSSLAAATPVTITGANAADFAIVPGTTTCTANFVLAATNGTCVINVTFTPSATGARTATINVADNAPGSPQTDVLNGTGTVANVTMAPSPVPFGNQQQSTTSSAVTISVSNTGTAPATLGAGTPVTITGANAADFAIVPGTTTCTANFPLIALTGTCVINVTFTPSATGARTAQVNVVDNAPGSPQTDILNGTGTISAVGLAPSPVPFGNQRVGTTSSSVTVTVTNTGNVSATLAAGTPVTITGANAGDFAIAGGTTCTPGFVLVATNGACVINLTVTPSATGARTATLNVADNAPGSPQTDTLNATGTAPAVTLSTNAIPFGNQGINTTSAVSNVQVTNSGTATLNVASITLTGADTTQFVLTAATAGTQCNLAAAFQVLAGANCSFGVKFAPTTVGAKAATVNVTDDAAGSPQLVTLSGTGAVAAVVLNPAPFNFPNQRVSTTSAATTITISNGGAAPSTLAAVNPVTFTGANAGDFAIAAGTTCVANFVLVANTGACIVNVTFTPGATGARTATLNISDDAPGSPQTGVLNGTGTAPAAVLAPNNIPFGNQNINAPSAVTNVQVSNTGTDTLNVASIALAGANSNQFALTVATSGTQCNLAAAFQVTAGQSCFFGVKFAPTTIGAKAATVNVTDDAAGSPQQVTLAGTGTSAIIALTPSPAPFGNQQQNTTGAAVTITVNNTGTASATLAALNPVTFTGANPGDFATAAGTTCVANFLLVANTGSCIINVTFTPAATGARTATLNLADDVLGSPQTDVLNGTGTLPIVSLAPSPVPFGNQRVATTGAAVTVTVTNNGNQITTLTGAPVTITGANAADFAFAPGTTCVANFVLTAGGGSCLVKITFTPGATLARTASLNIFDDTPGSPQSDVLNGTGTIPNVAPSPSPVPFGIVNLGKTGAAVTVTVTNSGTAPSSLAAANPVTITGANAADFATVAGTTCVANFVLAANGGFCVVNIAFTPGALLARTATLNIADDAPGSPQVDTLNGTGTQPGVNLSAANVAFGTVDVGDTKPASPAITLTNNGTGPLTIASYVINGANPGDFSQANTCPVSPATLAPGANCTVTPSFKPTAASARAANLVITDDAPGSPQTITLGGTGVDFTPGTAPAPVTIPAGQAAMYALTMNPGATGFPNAITFAASGAPAATIVTFNPASVTPGNAAGMTTMTITTTMRNGGTLPSLHGQMLPWIPKLLITLWGVFGTLLLYGLLKLRKMGRRRRLAPVLYMGVVLFAALGIAGCAQTGTPAGTYTITVTETSGNLSHQTQVTLTVQ